MPRKIFPEEAKEAIRQMWTKGAEQTFDYVDGLLWTYDVHGCDHDDQVRDAKMLGLLCGDRVSGVEFFLQKVEERWFPE